MIIQSTEWVYISGPMTGLPDFNFPLFLKVETDLILKFGCVVLNPARNFGGDQTRLRAEYMRIDISNLLEADVVVFLPGWHKSRGARLEYDMAGQLGLCMFARKESSELLTLPDNLLTYKLL